MDCIAVNRRTFVIKEEIFYYPGTKLNSTKLQNEDTVTKLKLEYGIAPLILAEDLLILLLMIALCLIKLFWCCSEKCSIDFIKWYNIILGPLFCIIIHSYHILVGFIHSPHHATSILVFYALILVTYVVTLKSAYHNIFKLFVVCCVCCSCTAEDETDDTDAIDWKKIPAHLFVLTILFGISVFAGLVFIYIAFLFILVPINNVIDDAPDRILNINQTIVILLGAAITFKLYQSRNFGSLLDYLVRASDDTTKNYPLLVEQAKNTPWKQNNRKQKRKAIASVLLTALNKQALSEVAGQPPTSTPQHSPPTSSPQVPPPMPTPVQGEVPPPMPTPVQGEAMLTHKQEEENGQ